MEACFIEEVSDDIEFLRFDREECEYDDWLIGDVAVMLTLRPLSVTVTEPVGVPPCDMSSANDGTGTGVVLETTAALVSFAITSDDGSTGAAGATGADDDELGSEEAAPVIAARSCC